MPSCQLQRFILALALLIGFTGLNAQLPIDRAPTRGPQTYPPAIGEFHPDFSAFDQDGQSFNLFAQRGKVVLLHMCALWCQPCRQSAAVEGDLIAQLNAELGESSWVLVDALFQDNLAEPSGQADAQAWRQVLGTPARTLHADNSISSELHLLGEQLISIPLFIVLDPEGRVTGMVEGFDGNTMSTLADLVRDSIDPPVFIDGFESAP